VWKLGLPPDLYCTTPQNRPTISLKQWGGILTVHMCLLTSESHEECLTAIRRKFEPRELNKFNFIADEVLRLPAVRESDYNKYNYYYYYYY
jgi:hypothetical protein